jgi:hypothetical protein
MIEREGRTSCTTLHRLNMPNKILLERRLTATFTSMESRVPDVAFQILAPDDIGARPLGSSQRGRPQSAASFSFHRTGTPWPTTINPSRFRRAASTAACRSTNRFRVAGWPYRLSAFPRSPPPSPAARFEFTFTPKHGSLLNLIEGFFSKFARSVLRHIRVASKQELKQRIMAGIEDVNRYPVIHTWSYKLAEAA